MKLKSGCTALFLFLVMAVCMVLASAALAAEKETPQDHVCGQCHGNENFKINVYGKQVSLYVNQTRFVQSVHGSLGCVSCHPEASIVPHQQVETAPETNKCFTCHLQSKKDYLQGVHALDNGAGAQCSDCHGTHYVQPARGPKSLVNRMNIASTCSSCHQGVVAESYAESFHGKAVSLGSTKAATCVDCHGPHKILGPENPGSTVAEANVPQTCAKCHQSPQANFANGKEHFALEPVGAGAPMYFTFKFFTWLTIITITLLIIHIELELFSRLRSKRS